MAVLVQHVSHAPPALRERHPTIEIDPEFEALLASLLAKNRDHRPFDARTLAGLLRRLKLSTVWDQDAAEAWAKRVGAWGYPPPPPVDLPFGTEDAGPLETPTASGPLRNSEDIRSEVDITRMQKPVS